MANPESPSSPDQSTESRWQVFRHRGYGNFLTGISLNVLAIQILTVAVGWQVYDLTRDPFDLGLVGLSQFAPALLLTLVSGAASDHFSRRMIMSLCLLLISVVSAGLLLLTLAGNAAAWPIFTLLILLGVARSFYMPSSQSLATNIVPAADLPRALALNNSAFNAATICGPMAGGLLYGVSPAVAYGTALVCGVLASGLIAVMPKPAQHTSVGKQRSWKELTAGFSFILSHRFILGAISLDLFVGLLGGAFAMLPVYARDVLHVGAEGLGLLRAAPAMGAILVALWLMWRPIRRGAGPLMFATVAGFAVTIMVFALSRNLWLSVLALALMGGTDMVSVIIRSTLVQLYTPDHLRGRVSAVNGVFIGASNELGEFRAGVMAALIGPVAAVFVGGAAALAICLGWMKLFPELHRVSEMTPEKEGTEEVG